MKCEKEKEIWAKQVGMEGTYMFSCLLSYAEDQLPRYVSKRTSIPR